ncbi:hypothetical protein IAT38_006942 [Cryptococcus sp. DSM 104549]
MERGTTVELTASGHPKRKRVRSVMGCLLCRRRRVKCDEKRPKCTNCIRHPLRVCEYEYDPPAEPQPSQPSQPSSNVSDVVDQQASTSAVASSSQVTIANEEQRVSAFRDESLPVMYQAESTMQVARAMAQELNSITLLNPVSMADTASLADAFLTKLPMSTLTNFASLLIFHSALVRQCFASLADDSEARLLCTATAVLSVRPTGPLAAASPSGSSWASAGVRRADVFSAYVRHVRAKKDNVLTGKLAGVGFTLLLCEALDPTPVAWREQLHIMVERSIDRGGPGWVIGVGQPLLGYKGGTLVNRQPLSFALYAEITAVTEIYACLTDGTIPLLLSPQRHDRFSWLVASRAAQVKVSATRIPDSIETMFGVPRILIAGFAAAVALVAKHGAGENEDDAIRESLEFEVDAFRSELENVWPARLDGRRDDRRLQYGGRLWRIALILLIMHKAQDYPLNSMELTPYVDAAYEICLEALSEIGHLAGWLWPILIIACACSDKTLRQEFLRLLRYAKGPVGDRDNFDVSQRMLTLIWFYHDIGQEKYHLREAVRDDPSLDILIF